MLIRIDLLRLTVLTILFSDYPNNFPAAHLRPTTGAFIEFQIRTSDISGEITTALINPYNNNFRGWVIRGQRYFIHTRYGQIMNIKLFKWEDAGGTYYRG